MELHKIHPVIKGIFDREVWDEAEQAWEKIMEFKLIERRCLNCKFYLSDKKSITGGWCQWARFNSVPVAFPELQSSTYSDWGEDCSCWIVKIG